MDEPETTVSSDEEWVDFNPTSVFDVPSGYDLLRADVELVAATAATVATTAATESTSSSNTATDTSAAAGSSPTVKQTGITVSVKSNAKSQTKIDNKEAKALRALQQLYYSEIHKMHLLFLVARLSYLNRLGFEIKRYHS